MTPAGAAELLERNGLPLDDATISKLLEYERLLLGWNEKINLVSRRDAADVFTRQIIGSVSFLFTHRLAVGTSVLDVGTGGGLPGIPLAVIHPDIAVTMADSIHKKMKAVGAMVAALGLARARTVCARVEDLDPAKTGTFDYVVARGVSSAAEIVGWCGKLLRTGDRGAKGGHSADPSPRRMIPPGSFILLKGGDLTGELEELSDAAATATVIVRPLTVIGAEGLFTDKKVIIVTP